MQNDKISFRPESMGQFLSETVRASLYSANPSAVIKKILEGIKKYQIENATAGCQEMISGLTYLYERLQVLEDSQSDFSRTTFYDTDIQGLSSDRPPTNEKA